MDAIWTMGEMLAEIMRPKPDMPLGMPAAFLGPYPSGAPAIFIDTAARLGHTAGIIGAVGADDFGSCLLERLRRDGVDCRCVSVDPELPTGVAFVAYGSDGSRRFLYHIGHAAAANVQSPDLSQMTVPGFFHIMGCSLMAGDNLRREIIRTMQDLAARGCRISFDPNIRPELLRDSDLSSVIGPVMACCSVLLPGVEELLLVTGKQTVEDAVARIFQREVAEIVALKRGKAGCTIYTRSETINLGIYPVDPVDPTGAGDCFDAAFLCGLLEKRSLTVCAKMASAAAALNTAAFGPMAGEISRNRLDQMMAEDMVYG